MHIFVDCFCFEINGQIVNRIPYHAEIFVNEQINALKPQLKIVCIIC